MTGRLGSSSRALLVDGEEIEGSRAVFGGGTGVTAGGFEAGIAEYLGDDDEIGPAAHEGVAKLCPRTWAVLSSRLERSAMPVIMLWAPLTPRH